MNKCCNSCAMLTCNKGKERGVSGEWYTQKNMDRIWESARSKGNLLICHSTDSNAQQYDGEEGIKPGNEKACLGFLLWVYMHLKIYEHLGSYAKYRNAVGYSVAMTTGAMGEFAFDIARGTTALIGKGMSIPHSIDEDRTLVYPTGFERTIKLFNQIINKPDEDENISRNRS